MSADAFLVHENSDGSLDKTKTDVLLHFVDPSDNSVREAGEVLKMIDYRTEELDPLFREFNVIDTEGVVAANARKASLVREEAMVFWLAGLCAFLFLLLIVIVLMHVHVRRKYARKLRAATTDAYGADDGEGMVGALNKRELVPNTNRHASEGSNPIWLTGVGYDNLGVR